MTGERRDGQYATYRVADAARNDFYMSNKWAFVDTLGRQFGSAKRERERVKERSEVTRLVAIKIFTALFRYNTTEFTSLPVKKTKERNLFVYEISFEFRRGSKNK